MQAINYDENSANQMDDAPAFSQPSGPNVGLEGAEAGSVERRLAWDTREVPRLSFGLAESLEVSNDNVTPTNSHPLLGHEIEFGFPTNTLGPQHDLFDFQPTAWPGIVPGVGTLNHTSNVNADYLWFQQPGPTDVLPNTQDNTFYLPGPAYLDPLVPQDFILQDPSALLNTQAPTVSAGPAVHPCTQLGCSATFKRAYERTRHEAAVHGINQGLHLCPVAGCLKSQGNGYSRADKVKEHLWKKHADLGYTKGR